MSFPESRTYQDVYEFPPLGYQSYTVHLKNLPLQYGGRMNKTKTLMIEKNCFIISTLCICPTITHHPCIGQGVCVFLCVCVCVCVRVWCVHACVCMLVCVCVQVVSPTQATHNFIAGERKQNFVIGNYMWGLGGRILQTFFFLSWCFSV